MTPDDPRHGTYTGYINHHCRCFDCRLACSQHRAGQRQRRQQGPHNVPATEAREHINKWRKETGRGQIVFAHAAGISRSVVRRIITGATDQIRRTTHDAVLAVPVDERFPRYTHLVPAFPTRRRVHALAALGWSLKQQSTQVGRSKEWLSDVTSRDFVTPQTAAMVAKLYDQLCMELPPEITKGERITVPRCRALAARKGWLPPLAWDDIDTDPEPTHEPQPRQLTKDIPVDHVVVSRILDGEVVPSTNAERREVVRRWVADGRSYRALEALTGWRVERYFEAAA